MRTLLGGMAILKSFALPCKSGRSKSGRFGVGVAPGLV
jgi:hypothetical protein